MNSYIDVLFASKTGIIRKLKVLDCDLNFCTDFQIKGNLFTI